MALKPSREIVVPFHIGAHGGIAFVEDPYRTAIQHLTSLLLTRPGERVMEPLVGSAVQNYVFEPVDDIVATELAQVIRRDIAAWEPAISIIDVRPEQQALEGNGIVVLVQFTIPPDDTVHETTVNLGGGFTEVFGG